MDELSQLLLSGVGQQSGLAQRDAAFQQEQQLGNYKIAALQAQSRQYQAEQAAAQQGQAAIQAYRDNPSDPNLLSNAILLNPQMAKQIQESHAILDKPAQDSQRLQLYGLYNAANNNKPALVSQLVGQIADAEEKGGIDATDARALQAAVDKGDPDAIKSALAFSKGHLALIDPDFAEKVGVTGDKANKPYTLGPGEIRLDENNHIVARGDPKPIEPHFYTLKDAQGVDHEFVYTGGSLPQGATLQQGAPSSAPSGRTYGGWTPSVLNGGDNPEASVVNKVKGASAMLGVGPDDDISKIPAVKIAQAMGYGEGGKGTIADTHNNGANIRNADGSYKRYPTKDAGLAAAAALVQRKLNAGQTTVSTMIRGLPAKGSPTTSGAIPGSQQLDGTPFANTSASEGIRANDISSVPENIRGAVQAIADGRAQPPRASTRNGEALLDAVTSYDPTFDAANATSRSRTRVDFTSGKSAQAVNAMNTAMGHLLHLDDQAHDLGNFSTAPGILNPGYNWLRSKVGGNTALGAFEQTKQAASSELRKVFAGASGGNLEELRQFEANLDSSKSPEQLHTVIANAVELLGSRLNALRDQYTQGMNRSDRTPQFIKPSIVRSAQQRFGVDLGGNPSGNPVRVTSPQQAASLPSGTLFVTPDGRTLRKR